MPSCEIGSRERSGDKFAFMSTDGAKKRDVRAIAAPLLFAESVLVLSLGIYMIALGFTHDKDWLPYLSVTGFALVGAVALYFLYRGVKEGKRWANSPAILANLIALGVAKYQFEAGAYWLAVPISAVALCIIITLLSIIKNSYSAEK
jgi:membrane protein YdbS with pleckstrin-like domain